MSWLGLLQWVATTLLPLCLSVALWLALIQIRGLRERAETAERAVQQIADAIKQDVLDNLWDSDSKLLLHKWLNAAKRANSTKESGRD